MTNAVKKNITESRMIELVQEELNNLMLKLSINDVYRTSEVTNLALMSERKYNLFGDGWSQSAGKEIIKKTVKVISNPTEKERNSIKNMFTKMMFKKSVPYSDLNRYEKIAFKQNLRNMTIDGLGYPQKHNGITVNNLLFKKREVDEIELVSPNEMKVKNSDDFGGTGYSDLDTDGDGVVDSVPYKPLNLLREPQIPLLRWTDANVRHVIEKNISNIDEPKAWELDNAKILLSNMLFPRIPHIKEYSELSDIEVNVFRDKLKKIKIKNSNANDILFSDLSIFTNDSKKAFNIITSDLGDILLLFSTVHAKARYYQDIINWSNDVTDKHGKPLPNTFDKFFQEKKYWDATVDPIKKYMLYSAGAILVLGLAAKIGVVAGATTMAIAFQLGEIAWIMDLVPEAAIHLNNGKYGAFILTVIKILLGPILAFLGRGTRLGASLSWEKYKSLKSLFTSPIKENSSRITKFLHKIVTSSVFWDTIVLSNITAWGVLATKKWGPDAKEAIENKIYKEKQKYSKTIPYGETGTFDWVKGSKGGGPDSVSPEDKARYSEEIDKDYAAYLAKEEQEQKKAKSVMSNAEKEINNTTPGANESYTLTDSTLFSESRFLKLAGITS